MLNQSDLHLTLEPLILKTNYFNEVRDIFQNITILSLNLVIIFIR